MTPRNSLHIVPLLLIALAGIGTAGAQLPESNRANITDRAKYERDKIPGHYTVGFYADEHGSSRELELPEGLDTFDAWLGITGDSTRVFGSLVMSLELPYGVEIAGPIVWIPRSGLKESGELLTEGMMVEFQYDCAEQESLAPAILGRLPLRLQPGVKEATLTPGPHERFGLSIQLCPGGNIWPKPYADPLSLTVRRHRSFWDRLTGWFD
jgi:hypothetical protein